jgi:CRISPR-associated protein Cas1
MGRRKRYRAGRKVLPVSHPVHLSASGRRLRAEDKNGRKVEFSIDEIDTVLLENRGISITVAALDLLCQNGVSVVAVDTRYHPSAILSPAGYNGNLAKMARRQIEISENGEGDELWRRIVFSKISRQAVNLSSRLPMVSERLRILAEEVEPGDPANKEGAAAAIYFPAFFGDPDFRRRGPFPDIRNSMLNYGYAILRGAMAREVAGRELQPGIGIWHSSRFNGFALVDDLVEPFRPYIDLLVKSLGDELSLWDEEMLTPEFKRRILSGFYEEKGVWLDGDWFTLREASALLADSFARVVEEGDMDRLLLPVGGNG